MKGLVTCVKYRNAVNKQGQPVVYSEVHMVKGVACPDQGAIGLETIALRPGDPRILLPFVNGEVKIPCVCEVETDFRMFAGQAQPFVAAIRPLGPISKFAVTPDGIIDAPTSAAAAKEPAAK